MYPLPKKALLLPVVMFFWTLCFSADHVSADELPEAAQNVQYMSQKITKAYFYKQMNIRPEIARQHLKKSLAQLDQDIPTLQEGVKGEDEKGVMTFLASTYDRLKEILSEPYSEENGALIMDASESLFDSAGFLAEEHRSEKRGAETIMFDAVKHQLLLLERINKYYIAHKAGFENENNVIQLKQAVTDFETGLDKISDYGNYPEAVQGSVVKVNKLWSAAKDCYLGVQKRALPVIVLAFTDKLEQELTILEDYHSQAAAGEKE